MHLFKYLILWQKGIKNTLQIKKAIQIIINNNFSHSVSNSKIPVNIRPSSRKNIKLAKNNFKYPKCRKSLSNSSSFGKYLRNVHGEKWMFPYCKKQYSDKGLHQVYKVKEKKPSLRFLKSFCDKNDQFTYLNVQLKKDPLFILMIYY